MTSTNRDMQTLATIISGLRRLSLVVHDNQVPPMEKIWCVDILMNSYLGFKYPSTDGIKQMAETALKFYTM